MTKLQVALALITTVALANPLAAQGRGRGNDGVPPGHRPPAGLCRVWIDGVPPGRQPAPTDCATAAANRTRNSRVIYGDRYDDRYDGHGKYKKSKHDDRRWTRINGQLCEVKDGKDGRVTYRCEGDQRDRSPYWDRNARRGDDDRDDDRDGNRDGARRSTQSTRDGQARRPASNSDITRIYGRRN